MNIMYKECTEILELLKSYLQQTMVGRTWIDYFVDYWIPIIGVVVLVITSFAAVYKYFKEKNRDLNEKILKEVYAPLFQYIIQQEYVRQFIPNLSIDEYPIISVTKKKTHIGSETIEFQDVLRRNDLLTVKKSINFGLAPQDLLVLLNVYEIVDSDINRVSDDEYFKIEMRLRTEVIEGYLKYRNKLGLDNKKHIIKYDKKQIVFNFEE